jgi:uncharacterized MAPEG superfamily protein
MTNLSSSTTTQQDMIRAYAPVIKATGVYFVLFFVFMMFQSFSKFYIFSTKKAEQKNKKTEEKVSLSAIKYGENKSGHALCSDRTFLNMLEHSPAFLISLWMHAVFVSPESAALGAYCYIAFRAIYPIAFTMGIPWLYISTFPMYWIVWYFIGSAVYQAIWL